MKDKVIHAVLRLDSKSDALFLLLCRSFGGASCLQHCAHVVNRSGLVVCRHGAHLAFELNGRVSILLGSGVLRNGIGSCRSL